MVAASRDIAYLRGKYISVTPKQQPIIHYHLPIQSSHQTHRWKKIQLSPKTYTIIKLIFDFIFVALFCSISIACSPCYLASQSYIPYQPSHAAMPAPRPFPLPFHISSPKGGSVVSFAHFVWKKISLLVNARSIPSFPTQKKQRIREAAFLKQIPPPPHTFGS